MNIHKDEDAVRNTLALSQQARYANRPEVEEISFDEKFVCKGHANEICAGLYLGDFTSASEDMLLHLKSLHVTGIVNCTIDCAFVHSGVDYIQVAVNDNEMANIKLYMSGCSDFIHKHISTGNSVLVHCQRGVSRSATIVIAYLMKYHNLSRDDAFMKAKVRRCLVSPNMGFWNQLKEFENELATPNVSKSDNHDIRGASLGGIDDQSTPATYDEAWCRQSCAQFNMSGCKHVESVSILDTESQQKVLYAGLDFVLGRCMVKTDIDWLRFICCESFEKDSSIAYLHNLVYDNEGTFMEIWGSDFGRPKLRQLLLELGADESSPLFMSSISEDGEDVKEE